MTLAAVCYALSVCAQDNKRIAPNTLSEGDLLFVWLRATTTSPM